MSPGPKPYQPENGQVWVKRGSDDDSPQSSTSAFLQVDSADVVDSRTNLINGQTPNGRVANSDAESASQTPVEPEAIARIPKWKRYCGVGILFFVNLLNYMDRYTIAGVLIEIQKNFDINNAMAGLLQTVFIISYMLFAPLFGYLGDRYNRILVMIVGMFIWSGCTLASSFIHKPEHFPLFLLTRALVGIGEASYSTIAPTLIGDMFVGSKRTMMLTVFFFATPVGSGLGYIVGSSVAKALGGWEWALRVTPGLGVLAIFLLICFCPNPPRGACESTGRVDLTNTHTYLQDIVYLAKNKSFISVTFGFTFMAFVVGSLTLWGPTYFAYSQVAIGELQPCLEDDCSYAGISFTFGVITCIAGFAGVGIGAEWARRWKLRGCMYADALVCAFGLLMGSPLLCVGVLISQLNITVSWIFIFFADLSLCLTWTLISDMTLYVTEPSRRSTANAAQLLIGHLFGDAGSPYLLGLIADSLAEGKPDSYTTKYLSLQHSMFITLFVCIIGGGLFLLASLYVVADKKKVDDFLKGKSDSSDSTKTTSSGTSTNNSLELEQKGGGSKTLPNGHVPVVQVNGETETDSARRDSYESSVNDDQTNLLGINSTV